MVATIDNREGEGIWNARTMVRRMLVTVTWLVKLLRFAIRNKYGDTIQATQHGYGARSSCVMFYTYRFWLFVGVSMLWKSSSKQSVKMKPDWSGLTTLLRALWKPWKNASLAVFLKMFLAALKVWRGKNVELFPPTKTRWCRQTVVLFFWGKRDS